MRNIQIMDVTMKELVKNIISGQYLIPSFQRNFVWNNKDIAELGDSIIRGYPISSFLTMNENGKLKINSNNLSNTNYIKAQKDTSGIYILDGQQRITSISKIFCSSDNKKEFYFDLLSILDEKFLDDNILNKECIKKTFLESRSSSKIEDIFCRCFDIGANKDERPTRCNYRFISGKTVISDKSGAMINKFLRNFSNDEFAEDTLDEYTNYLNALLNSISAYSIPTTVISADADLSVVIRVFEKVNSTGKKLSLFDLINAKSFETKKQEYRDGLSNYLQEEIIKKTEKSYSKIQIYNFLGYVKEKQYFDSLGKIPRIFEFVTCLKKMYYQVL